jgi:protein phosphatase
VAVFQGIPGRIAGFELSTVDYLSDTSIDELTPVAQERVKEGIPSDNQADAREQLATLLDPASKNVLPFCPTPTPTPVATATAGAAAPSGTRTPGPTGSATPAVQSTEPPQPSGPPDCRPTF